MPFAANVYPMKKLYDDYIEEADIVFSGEAAAFEPFENEPSMAKLRFKANELYSGDISPKQNCD